MTISNCWTRKNFCNDEGGMPLKKRSMKHRNHPARLGNRGRLCFCVYAAAVCAFCLPVSVFAAAGDPLTVVSNLSTFIFSLIRAHPAGLGCGAGGPLLPEPRPVPALPGISHPGRRPGRDLRQGDPGPYHRRHPVRRDPYELDRRQPELRPGDLGREAQ